MSAAAAHQLLDAARAGVDISERTITRCLLETGDLSSVDRYASPAFHATAGDLHAQLLKTARKILDANGAGSVSDAFAIEWAEIILRQNLEPITRVPYDDDLPPEMEP